MCSAIDQNAASFIHYVIAWLYVNVVPKMKSRKFYNALSKTDDYAVVILINATTLMHKWILNTNNFGNNHFGQKYQKQNILRIFRRL